MVWKVAAGVLQEGDDTRSRRALITFLADADVLQLDGRRRIDRWWLQLAAAALASWWREHGHARGAFHLDVFEDPETASAARRDGEKGHGVCCDPSFSFLNYQLRA